MKPLPLTLPLLLAAVLAGGPAALAQSNGVPGPEDYSAFTRFITERNIFDPARQPQIIYTPRTYRPPATRVLSPDIQLVGTMTYEKGPFAFFNASSSEYRKALQTGDTIAGYTVTEIAPDFVQLESADKLVRTNLDIGDGLRPENGKWVVTKAGELSVAFSGSAGRSSGRDRSGRDRSGRGRSGGYSYGSDSSGGENSNAAPAAPPSVGEPNEILKRLMQLREQESQ